MDFVFRSLATDLKTVPSIPFVYRFLILCLTVIHNDTLRSAYHPPAECDLNILSLSIQIDHIVQTFNCHSRYFAIWLLYLKERVTTCMQNMFAARRNESGFV